MLMKAVCVKFPPKGKIRISPLTCSALYQSRFVGVSCLSFGDIGHRDFCLLSNIMGLNGGSKNYIWKYIFKKHLKKMLKNIWKQFYSCQFHTTDALWPIVNTTIFFYVIYGYFVYWYTTYEVVFWQLEII